MKKRLVDVIVDLTPGYGAFRVISRFENSLSRRNKKMLLGKISESEILKNNIYQGAYTLFALEIHTTTYLYGAYLLRKFLLYGDF